MDPVSSSIHYQSSADETAVISAGGVTLSSDKSDIFYSVTSGDDESATCHVYRQSLNDAAAAPVDLIPRGAGVSCYYLERHYSVLLELGFDYTEGTGSLNVFNLQKDNARDYQILMGQAEQPIGVASSLKEAAVFVVSQVRASGDEDDDEDEDSIGDIFGGGGDRNRARNRNLNQRRASRLMAEEVPLPPEVYQFFPQLPFPSSVDPNPPFALRVTRFDQQMNPRWHQTYVAHRDAQVTDSPLSHVFTSAVVAYDDFLVVVGSTAGHGPAFGASTGTDYDGFLTKINFATGELMPSGTKRFGSGMDDWALNVCYATNASDNEGDDELKMGDPFIYIVGTTKGSKWGGWVTKFDLTTLSQVWSKMLKFSSTNDNWATHCHVKDNVVYVTGVVDGGPLQTDDHYYGKSDVFVAKVDDGGQLLWTQQLGSSKDDRPAGIEVLDDESIIIYGETSGSVYAENTSGRAATVLWTVDGSTGTLKDPQLEDECEELEPTDKPTVQPTVAPIPNPTIAPTTTPVAAPPPPIVPLKDTPPPVAPTESDSEDIVRPEDIDAELEEPPPPEEWTPGDLTDETKPGESLVSHIVERGPGFQSNMGPSYAGGMVYDFDRHSVYLTGSSYGHEGHEHDPDFYKAHCFLTHLQLVRYESKHLTRASEEDEDLVQSCNTIAQSGNHLFLAGMQVNDPKKSLYSILSHLERSSDQPDWAPVSDSWLQEDTIPIGYPVSVLTDERPGEEEQSVFVLTLQSSEAQLNTEYATHYNPEAPNLTPGGHVKYGEHFQVLVQNYRSSNDPSQDKFVQHWQRLLEIDQDNKLADTSFLSASAIVQLGDKLYVAGSLKGILKGVSVTPIDGSADHGMDGFVIAMEAADGTSTIDDHSRIFDSRDHRDEWIHNMCVSSSSSDGDFLYIVGSTDGDLGSSRQNGPEPVDAFVAKLDAATLKTVWVQQFHTSNVSSSDSKPSAVAYGCAVVPREGILYVAGVVENGGSIDLEERKSKSHGDDDIFVARLDTLDGAVRWLRQIGTSGTENLARSQGIVADMDSNAVIYGETTGELFRSRSSFGQGSDPNSPDIFVVTLDKATGYTQTVESVKFDMLMATLIGTAILCLCLGGFRYFWKSRQKDAQSKFFPRYDSDDFHDEEEELVPGAPGQVELVESSSLGTGQQGVNGFSKTRGLDDFMPQYYSDNPNASHPGRNVV
jgi:hypothetical protein